MKNERTFKSCFILTVSSRQYMFRPYWLIHTPAGKKNERSNGYESQEVSSLLHQNQRLLSLERAIKSKWLRNWSYLLTSVATNLYARHSSYEKYQEKLLTSNSSNIRGAFHENTRQRKARGSEGKERKFVELGKNNWDTSVRSSDYLSNWKRLCHVTSGPGGFIPDRHKRCLH